MCRDIEVIRGLGALTENRKIDERTMNRFVDTTGDLDITFHRAFDEISDHEEGIKTLSGFSKVKRILTSRGKKSALDVVPQIKF